MGNCVITRVTQKKPKLLGANTAPTVNIGAGSVQVAASEYTAFMVSVHTSSSLDSTICNGILMKGQQQITGKSYFRIFFGPIFRGFTITDTQFSGSTGYEAGGAGNSGICIPVELWGII